MEVSVFISRLKAFLTRLVFMVHAGVTVWRVVDAYDDTRYWYLGTSVFLLFLEGVFTIIKRKGQEGKW